MLPNEHTEPEPIAGTSETTMKNKNLHKLNSYCNFALCSSCIFKRIFLFSIVITELGSGSVSQLWFVRHFIVHSNGSTRLRKVRVQKLMVIERWQCAYNFTFVYTWHLTLDTLPYKRRVIINIYYHKNYYARKETYILYNLPYNFALCLSRSGSRSIFSNSKKRQMAQ